jgi:hypothetical protein
MRAGLGLASLPQKLLPLRAGWCLFGLLAKPKSLSREALF